MTKLVLKKGPGPGRVLELRFGLNTVGRDESNDFPIDSSSVSGHHCVLASQAGHVMVRDLDSTNGTFIDGHLIREATLHPGQTLRLGDVELLWPREPITVSIPHVRPEPPQTEVQLSDGRLSCLNHPTVAAVWHCPECQRHFCTPCLHHLRLVGRRPHHYCPTCSVECEWIGPKREEKTSLMRSIRRAVRSLFRNKQ